ncbi:putative flagellar export pore protein [Candidatus Sulfopaludibacter sp. SbA3]|nr:putative flagellar export pore protein [Candidatus Sulfopaludibacter sp. SbA3]
MAEANAIAAPQGNFGKVTAAAAEMAVPLAVLAIIIALITPMPGFLLDFLLVIDIMLSVIVLMVSMYLTRPVEFSVFPTTLLLLTLFRLALNVSSSRLILLNGNAGTSAAGDVIESFGNFVVGGNYIIGAVIFLILIAIQYVVINHGAVRISEVTARFTLDALPGKQMSIDSDLHAGLIDEAQARKRRKDLAAEAEFYGAMDGASRFTQRDAMASILITAINIIAGFLIGVLQHGMDMKRAIQTYTILTIGDGLVTVIPALMISVSGAMIITRAASDNKLGTDFRMQVFGKAQPLLFSAGVLIALAAFPGLPKIPFLVMGVSLGAVALRMRKKANAAVDSTTQAPLAPAKETVEDLLKVDPLAIDVGLGLVKLVEGGGDSPLLRRVAAIRKQLVTDLGYILPAVRMRDNLSLKAHEYAICMKGVEISRFEVPPGCELAIAVGKPSGNIDGIATREPAFGIPALWIRVEKIEAAKKAGYTVVDPVTVMGTHISEFVRRYAHEMFSRQDVKKLLDRVAVDNPKVVEDLVPKLLPLSTVQRVFQNLLRERVSIRDSLSILEALGEAAASTRNPVLLTEFVRQSIRRAVVKPYLNKAGELPAYFLETNVERAIESGVEHAEQTSHLNTSPEALRDVVGRVERSISKPEAPVVLLTGAATRYFARQVLENSMPNLFVLSHNEIPPELKVVSLGMVQ